MKKTIALALICFAVVACNETATETAVQNTQPDDALMQSQIDSVKNLVIQSFENIWSDLDVAKIPEHHTSDFLLLENGVLWSNDSVAYYLNKERARMEEQQYQRLNRFEFHKSVHNQTSIWVAYDNYGTWVKGQDTIGAAHWLESAVAVKDGGKWKLEQLHSTRVRK